jgi:hypothetical protein
MRLTLANSTGKGDAPMIPSFVALSRSRSVIIMSACQRKCPGKNGAPVIEPSVTTMDIAYTQVERFDLDQLSIR